MAQPSPLRRSVTGRVLVVAHRGLSAEEPENTMRSFRRAAEVGCDLIELDVHQTRDDVPVVIHDDSLDRTTDGHGLVGERTYAELRGLDAGRGERIPSLEDVVEWAARSGARLSVEIKQPTPATGLPRYDGLAERVVAVLRAAGMDGRCLIHSFDHPTAKRVREVWPDAVTAVSYGPARADSGSAAHADARAQHGARSAPGGGTFIDPLVLGRAADASGIHPWWAWVSPEVCAAAHAAGMHVHAWGTSWPPRHQEIALLVRAGVDSLDANDPRTLREMLEAL